MTSLKMISESSFRIGFLNRSSYVSVTESQGFSSTKMIPCVSYTSLIAQGSMFDSAALLRLEVNGRYLLRTEHENDTF